jgi:hypothetical protein
MRIKFLLLTAFALACLLTGLSLRPAQQPVSAQAGTVCLEATAPLVTHGVTTNSNLPNGDLFSLAQGLGFVAAGAPAGSSAALLTNANFGSNPNTDFPSANFGSVTPLVLTSVAANSTLRAVSCTDSFWDINFSIAAKGAAAGDRVRLSLVGPGGAVTNLVEFTVRADVQGVTLTGLNASAYGVFNNDITTNTGRVNLGDSVLFTRPGGTSGMRTNNLTLALGQDLMFCSALAVEIIRAGGTANNAMTSVAITSVIVVRTGAAQNAAQAGLIAGLTGGFPTGRPAGCDRVCPPPCPPVSNLMCPFNMICFHTPGYYCGGGTIPQTARTVRIPQVNFGYPVYVRSFGALNPVVQRYLGCGPYYYESEWYRSRILTKYYIAAQFSIADVDATAPITDLAENVSVGCYLQPAMMGMPAPNPGFPVTLTVRDDSGRPITINAGTKFCVLFDATERAIQAMNTDDINKLIAVYRALLTCEGD